MCIRDSSILAASLDPHQRVLGPVHHIVVEARYHAVEIVAEDPVVYDQLHRNSKVRSVDRSAPPAARRCALVQQRVLPHLVPPALIKTHFTVYIHNHRAGARDHLEINTVQCVLCLHHSLLPHLQELHRLCKRGRIEYDLTIRTIE